MSDVPSGRQPRDFFIHEVWQLLEETYRSGDIHLESEYVRCMEQLWTLIPERALAAVVAANRAMFANPGVLHRRLCSISREEACGASLLRWASQRCDGDLVDLFAEHARDEERHSKIYLAVCDLVQPARSESRPKRFTVRVEDELRADAGSGEVSALLASIHVGEVRNLMNLHLYLHLAREFRRSYAVRFESVLRSVRSDELRHARYTAGLVNRWIRADEHIRAAFGQIVKKYVDCWWEDIERIARWFEEEAPLTA